MSYKPSYEEMKWAKSQEYENRKNLKKRYAAKKLSSTERSILECPVDSASLIKKEVDSTGIIIQKCPVCKGIWIDRKSLEKLFQSEKNSKKFLKTLSHALDIHLSKIED